MTILTAVNSDDLNRLYDRYPEPVVFLVGCLILYPIEFIIQVYA